MKSFSILFTSPYQVAIQQEELPEPGPGQVRVKALLSAVSAGTELLIYRGQFPQDLPVDESLAALSGAFAYPLRYGYAAVGVVEAAGEQVDISWVGRRVFAFQPHVSSFLAVPGELFPIPEDLPSEEAVYMPNMETTVIFLLDGAPRIGERVAVFGQGIVGLLTTALLTRFPLACLATLDRYLLRREASRGLNVQYRLDPLDSETPRRLTEIFPGGADLQGSIESYRLVQLHHDSTLNALAERRMLEFDTVSSNRNFKEAVIP
jgi:threonine dehydrogenase-like Zn-dependent dehydrogenase